MNAMRVIPDDITMDETYCFALWREGLPCPNVAEWRISNLTNAGYSLMCTPHAEGFHAAYPDAAVQYSAIQPAASPGEEGTCT
jgi:hypothetical protein